MTNEKCAGDIIALAVGHKQGIQFVDQFVFNAVEALRSVVLGDDHTVEHLNSIFAQLVVVAETKIDDMSHKSVQGSLVILQRSEATDASEHEGSAYHIP